MDGVLKSFVTTRQLTIHLMSISVRIATITVTASRVITIYFVMIRIIAITVLDVIIALMV